MVDRFVYFNHEIFFLCRFLHPYLGVSQTWTHSLNIKFSAAQLWVLLVSLFATLLQNSQMRGRLENFDITTEFKSNFDFCSPIYCLNLPNACTFWLTFLHSSLTCVSNLVNYQYLHLEVLHVRLMELVGP